MTGFLMCTVNASAITWEFDEEGDAQGWKALNSVAQSVEMVIDDGLLRVASPPISSRTFRLLSPRLGLDSRLFDRVQVRMRIKHTAPLAASIALVWTNALTQSLPELPIRYIDHSTQRVFYVSTQVTLTSEWQEVTLSNSPE